MRLTAIHNETDLLERLRLGSHEAFTLLYRHYSEPLYYNILALVKDPTVAEELVQEIFSRIWQKHAEIHIKSSFGGYLFQSSRNTVYNFFDKLGREQKVYDQIKKIATENYSHVEESLLARENKAILAKAINSLSPQRRRAFELCKLEGRSYQEAADLMGISLNTLREHMAEARQGIREFLQENRELVIVLMMFMLQDGRL